ncbi:MAG: hypothetical protein Q7T26_03130 [Dehalococcoidia bacterium]|nr:hypothetical protein [Dehalococcoidia bacterium]
MRILHILRSLDDARAVETACAQREQGHDVALMLLHDAVLARPAFPGPVSACADDVRARGGHCAYPTVDYDAIVRMMFEHDRVVSW